MKIPVKVSKTNKRSKLSIAKTRLLVVEDEGASARLIEMTLKSLGYAVPAIVSSGEEAINKAGEMYPDLVLMDIHLKGEMDGVQAAEEISARFDIPVVYLTGNTDDDILQRVKITEPYGYILKPFQKRELHTSIEIALHKHKMDIKLKDREQAFERLTTELKTSNEQLQREITKHKQAKKKIKQVAQEWQTTFDSITDLVSIHDKDFKFVRVNKSFADVFKIEPKELIGKTCYEIVHGENEPWLDCPHKQTLEDGKPHMAEFFAPYLGVYLQMSSSPIYNEGNEIVGSIHIMRDVSKRRQTEETLRESEERYKTLFESAAEGIVIVDAKTKKYKYANPAICTMLGYSHEELIKMGVVDIHPEFALEHVLADFAAQEKGEKVLSSALPCLKKDGTIIYADIKAAKAIIDGKAYSVGFFSDVTERKQTQEALTHSEERYRDLFDNTNDLIQSITADGRFIYVNNAWQKVLGYSKDEIANLKVWGIIHPDSLPHCEEAFQRVMSGETVKDIETVFVAKDGRLVVVEGNAQCYFDNGKPVGTQGIFHDITDRKEAQQEQEKLSQQLQARVQELEALSYGIAHDLRSPLLSIEGFSRLLRDDIQSQKTERVQEDIRMLESGVRKMQQFLDRTLEYSRAGHLVKLTRNIPFGKIVKELIKEFAEQLHSIGATVTTADTFPIVCVDETRIRQVLTNLIQNSIKYRNKTRPLSIEIGYRFSKDEVIFFVRDNGVGVDKSETEKIFDLFYRGTTDSEGSGAGLAIVKRIIEAHGGRVWIESQPKKGTTMCFTLPSIERHK